MAGNRRSGENSTTTVKTPVPGFELGTTTKAALECGRLKSRSMPDLENLRNENNVGHSF